MSDKDFKVKNKLVVNGLTGGAGPLVANSNKEIDSVAFLTTLQGGTGTTTSPSAGQVLYSAGGTTYNPTTLNTLDVKGATYSADAPSSPVVGQIWVESDVDSDSFDPNIIRRKTFTATAAQTVFTTDVEFIQGYEQVFFNGMLLIRNSDYTTASNTNVTLAAGAAVGDILEVVSITNLNSINTATTTTNTFTGNQVINANLGINQSNPVHGLDSYKFAGSAAYGTRSDGARILTGYTIASNSEFVGRGVAFGVKDYTATIQGTDGSFNNYDLTINPTAGNVGIGVTGPLQKIDVAGNINMNTLITTAGRKASYSIGVGDGGIVGQKSDIAFVGEASSTYGILTNILFRNFNGDFYNSGLIERMRINYDGRVGIGVSAPRALLEVAGSILTHWDNCSIGTMFADGSQYFLGIKTQVSPRFTDVVANYGDNGAIRFISGAAVERARFESTNGYMLVGYTASNGAYRLQVNSQIFATSSSIATSDGRYKENVDTITSGLNIVDSLRPVSFTWKDHPVHNFVSGKTVGFIAQEVQEALSEYDWADNIIKTNVSEAVLDEEGNEVTPAEEFLGIAESNIIPLLVAAVKELKARVETLEANNV